MNEKFEKELAKCIENEITAFEVKLSRLIIRNSENDKRLKVGKPLRYLFYDRTNGFVKLQIKYQYSPDEIELLEMVRKLSEDKLKNLKEYMAQLLENEIK